MAGQVVQLRTYNRARGTGKPQAAPQDAPAQGSGAFAEVSPLPDDRERSSAARGRRARRSGRVRDEAGITTAEYAVGTAAGAGFAGLLYKLLTGGFGNDLLGSLFKHVMGLLGI